MPPSPSRDLSDLIHIMRALRDPVDGCAWDKEQDFRSIAPYTIEEAYEVADAIERGDLGDLCDELGDLLLQVVYHSQLAAEVSAFEFGDVVLAITSKMIRRHPHVFGDEAARSAGMAKAQWEKVKEAEKAERASAGASRGAAAASILAGIPATFPALTAAAKLQRKAASVGFDWAQPGPILAKIDEELGELRTAVADGDHGAVEDELGDLLFSVVNLARHLEIDPEAALRRTNTKFRRRFAFVERDGEQRGVPLGTASLEQMEAAWVEAKRAERLGD